MLDTILNFLSTEGEYLLRLIVAAICGAAIGYERKSRLKEAGLRTHLIVSLASALMMLVSKYGFFDLIEQAAKFGTEIKLDPSRVAAGIVTGIGFVGAGTIFIRKNIVSGLTTAAGIWATVGVGMAVGAGMYFIGIGATILIVLVQILLHKDIRWIKGPTTEMLLINILNQPEALDAVKIDLEKEKIEVVNIKAEKVSTEREKYIELELFVKFPKTFDPVNIMDLFKENDFVKSIEY
ncbi:MAG: MgtC/SapB family protein [Clostridia bacterium]